MMILTRYVPCSRLVMSTMKISRPLSSTSWHRATNDDTFNRTRFNLQSHLKPSKREKRTAYTLAKMPKDDNTELPMVRMIVLETDEPHPDDHHEKGSLGEILHRHFVKAGERHDPPLGIETDQIFVVKEKGGRIPKKEEFDGVKGVLITGSMYDAHGDDEWIVDLLDLLRELWKTRPDLHFSGVCFGHQLLSRLLGAEVKATGDWELGHSSINLSPIGKKLFRTDDDTIHLHQMHQDQVVKPPSVSSSDLLPKDATVHVWGHSDHTSVQGLYIRNRIFTTQAHMAFDDKMVKREIQMRIDSGSIKDKDDEEKRKAVETSHLEHDGGIVAAAILRFFHFEDDGLE